MDTSRILDGLNEAQRGAVTSQAKVLQILAPPGSGKTKTLTSRVSWLLFNQGYKPWNVICLTFTIKSAREMKERIGKQIGEEFERKLILGTFHSVCLRYLRTYGHLIGLPKGFDIADSSDSQAIVKRIIKQKNFMIDPSTARSRISHNKAKGKTYLDVQRDHKKSVEQQEFTAVFEAYEAYLEQAKLLDYDDLLVRCSELLRSHPQCVTNVEAVLIDEFQDTNHIQFDLMQLFARHCQHITTVGDPDQSIYGWRSAEIENLNKMRRIYLDTLVLNLENNYRSSPTILKAAQAVIEQDTARPQKCMVATHHGGSRPVLRRLFSPKTQASWIVTEIKRCRAATGNILLEYTDFAVLIRSAALSRQIETAMGTAGIPYRMVGGLRFFDRKEIKVLLDYMRVVSHPENNDAIARIINYPPRGIGEKTIKTIQEKATSSNKLWWDLIGDEIGHKKPLRLKESTMKGIRAFHQIIDSCRKAYQNETNPKYPLELLELIIKKLDFESHLEKEYPDDHEQRWANIEELKVQASEYVCAETEAVVTDDALPEIEDVEQQQSNPAQEALTKFLGNIALSTELQTEQELDDEGKPLPKVTISTIHAAKGLEWPVVFIPCVYKGSIPHSRSEDEDEERRLLYVAMTRAQALLYLTCPQQGQMSEEYILSPFLEDQAVSRCLTNRAPSIYDQVKTISEILRRECPPAPIVQEALQGLDCIEDDNVTWPLDGEKGVGDDGSSYVPRPDRKSYDQSLTDIASKSSGFTRQIVSNKAENGNLAALQTGFVSATSQHKRSLPVEQAFQTSTTTSKAVTNPPKRARITGTSSSQATIGKFFGQKVPDSVTVEEPVLPSFRPRLAHTKSTPAASTRVFDRKVPSLPRAETDSIDLTREPLSPLKADITNHRIPRNTGLQRHKACASQYTSEGPFILNLSSSPTKPESPGISPKTEESNISLPKHPAITNHMTTISALQQQRSALSQRPIGRGRPFVPWSSKSTTKFSVPKISKPRPT